MHPCQERAAAAAEVQQPALAAPGEDLMLATGMRFVFPFRVGGSRNSPRRCAMGAVFFGIELPDRFKAGARIGEAQAAPLALHDAEPEAGAARGCVRRFHQGRAVAAAAQQAIGLLPLDDRPRGGYRSGQIARKKAHP